MLFKSNLLAQASGSLGGTVFSRNRGGMYTRSRSVPTNPNTGAQAAVRANLAMCSQAWMLLSDANRSAWATYAANVAMTNRLGDTVFLTGQQMYLRTNCVRVQCGLTPVDTGPTTYNLGEIGDISLEAPDVSTQAMGFNFNEDMAWVTTTGAFLAIYVSRPVAPSINFFKGPFNFVDVIAGNAMTPPTSPGSIGPGASAFTLANKVFSKFQVLYADGRMTNPIIAESPPAVA